MPEKEHEENERSFLSAIESVLFVHGEPLSVAKLGKIVGASEPEVLASLEALASEHASLDRGLKLIRNGNMVELSTKPENAPILESFLRAEREENLGKATLEVLSIVAYRSPVTRAKIDAIRGVNCSFALRNLLIRGLIDREPNPLDVREFRYRPSMRLLELLGIASIEELPKYKELSQDVRVNQLDSEQATGSDENEENKSVI